MVWRARAVSLRGRVGKSHAGEIVHVTIVVRITRRACRCFVSLPTCYRTKFIAVDMPSLFCSVSWNFRASSKHTSDKGGDGFVCVTAWLPFLVSTPQWLLPNLLFCFPLNGTRRFRVNVRRHAVIGL